jgi:type I restriction enzyme S subunit
MKLLLDNNFITPNGWVITALESICDITAGSPAPQGEKFFEGGVFPFVRVQDMGRLGQKTYLTDTKDSINDIAISKLKLFPKGSVLFTKSGASTLNNQRAILGQDSYVVSHIAAAISKNGVFNKWIYFCLKCVDFADLAHSSVMPSLPLSKVKPIQVLLPPTNEQHRIIAKIEALFSELDNGIESLKTAREQLKIFRQTLLKHAFEGKLTSQFHEDGSKVKNNWKERTLGSLLCFITSGSRGWAQYYSNTGDTFIRAQNLKYDNLDLSEKAFVSLPDRAEGLRTRIQLGDLLITITGANVTKSALVEKDIGVAYVSQHVALCRPVQEIIPKYLYWFIVAEAAGRKQLGEAAYGAGKPGLNLENIRSLVVPLPSYLEQKAIVELIEEKLSVVEQLDQTLATALQQAEVLRQSILKKAFSGQLVPQDPNDEPASILLERIKAEKAALVTPIKKGKNMPEISRFLGIIIFMYFDEHNPPHFHVKYNEYNAVMEIQSLNILAGYLPGKVRGLVEEWAEPNQEELLAMWNTKDFHKIKPLV